MNSPLEQIQLEKLQLKHSALWQKTMAFQKALKHVKKGQLKKAVQTIWQWHQKKHIASKLANHLDRPRLKRNEVNWKQASIAAYTCAFGSESSIQPPLISSENLEYVLFTDHPEDYQELKESYTIVPIDPADLPAFQNNPKEYIKLHPHKYLKDYDYAIYLDPSIRSISDLREWIESIPDETGLAMFNHDLFDDVFSLAKAAKTLRLEHPDQLTSQMARYRHSGLARHYGLVDTRIMAMDLKNPRAAFLLKAWAQEIEKAHLSMDELVLPFILFENDVVIEEIGNLGNNIYLSPKTEVIPYDMESL